MNDVNETSHDIFRLASFFRRTSLPPRAVGEQGRERADWLRNWILSETRAHRNKLASGVENAHQADAATQPEATTQPEIE